MRKFIITGGPNSGKSTTIDLLSKRGYSVLRETSRIVIEQMNIFPWDGQELFCEVCRNEQMGREKEISGSIVFLDRSLVGPVAHSEIAGVGISKDFYQNTEEVKHESPASILEMLPNYVADALRKDSPEDAAAVHKRLRVVYERPGFRLVDAPLFSSNEHESNVRRIEFILSQTDSHLIGK